MLGQPKIQAANLLGYTTYTANTLKKKTRLKYKTDPLNLFKFHFNLLILVCLFQSSKFQIYSIKAFLSTFVKKIEKISGKYFSIIN